jgi:hypothetical protein
MFVTWTLLFIMETRVPLSLHMLNMCSHQARMLSAPVRSPDTKNNCAEKQKRQPAWVGVLFDTVLGGPRRNRTTDTRIFNPGAALAPDVAEYDDTAQQIV